RREQMRLGWHSWIGRMISAGSACAADRCDPGLSTRGPLLRSVPQARGDPQLVRFASLSGLLLPPGPLPSPLVVRSFGAFHKPGGIRSLSASLRSAGCSSPLDPFPLHSWSAPSERSTSQGGSAACPLRFAQRAAPPPWTPSLSTRGPLLRSVPQARGDPQLVRFASLSGLLLPPGPLPSPLVVRSFGAFHKPGGIRSLSASLRSAGCSSPLDPFPLHSWSAPSERSTSQGGSAACPLRFAQRAAPPP